MVTKDLLDTVEELRALVVEILRARQTRIVVVGILRDPHRHVRVRAIHLPHMARKPIKVAIPVHGYEIRTAIPRASCEKGLQPCEPARRARHGRRAKLDAHLLQRLHFAHPRLRRKFRVDVTAAVAGAIRFVKGQDVGDVGAAFDEIGDVVEEGVVGGAGRGTPEHGHEFKFGAVVESGGRLRAVVVVPC